MVVAKGMGIWEAMFLKSGLLGVFYFLKGPSKAGTKRSSALLMTRRKVLLWASYYLPSLSFTGAGKKIKIKIK